MSRKPCFVGGYAYPTKGKLKSHLIALKEKTTVVYPSGSKEYDLILDLIRQGHHSPEEKIGCGVKEFYVDSVWKNGKEVTRFMIRRVDGTTVDFSYLKSHTNIGSTQDEREYRRWRKYLDEAYRNAVKDQTDAYRRNNPLVCAFCGATGDDAQHEVDHYNPDFIEMTMEFEKEKVLPTEFDEVEDFDFKSSPRVFKKEDYAYMQEFQEYHRQTAHMRMLCVPCSLARTKVRRSHGPPQGIVG